MMGTNGAADLATGAAGTGPLLADGPDADAPAAGIVAAPEHSSQLPAGPRARAIRSLRRHVRAIRLVLNAMLLLALLYTVAITKVLLIPLVLAAFIALALNPVVAIAARRLHMPRWMTAGVIMLSLLVAIGAGTASLAQPAMGWFHGAPAAIKTFVPKLRRLTTPLEAANRATQTLVSGTSRARPVAPASISITPWDVVSTAPKILAAILGVVLLVFFFLTYGDTMLRRLVEISPSFAYKRYAVEIARDIQTEISRYLLTASLINAALGAVTAGMLTLYGVPDALLWGTVAMFANFVPYVGAMFTTILLAVVSMLYARDVNLDVFLPPLAFAAITALEGNVITPLIQGRSMRLSPIAILLWLLLWGWLWGIPGALLAVPMLTCTKLVCERVRGWAWFAVIVGR